MIKPQFVLIHGGSATSGYYDLLRPHLKFPSMAVDLPGRGSKNADINEICIGDWVNSVVEDRRH